MIHFTISEMKTESSTSRLLALAFGLYSIINIHNVRSEESSETNNALAVFFFTGAKLENPYKITTPGGAITTGNSESSGFIELNLAARGIFRTGRFADWQKDTNGDGSAEYFIPVWDFIKNTTTDDTHRFANPDLDLRVGYTFRGTDAPGTFNSSTIAQGSDYYFDGGFGLPWVRYDSGTGFRVQSTLEIGGGVTTDKDGNKLHPSLFLGGGLQLVNRRNSAGVESGPGDVFFTLRAGMAKVNQPILNPGGTTVALDPLGKPTFDWGWTPSFGTSVIMKLTDAFAAQLGANVYFTDVSSWNVTAGVNIDPAKLFGLGKK